MRSLLKVALLSVAFIGAAAFACPNHQANNASTKTEASARNAESARKGEKKQNILAKKDPSIAQTNAKKQSPSNVESNAAAN